MGTCVTEETNAANSKAIKDKIKKNAKLRNQMLNDFQDFERKAVSSALSRRFYAQSKDAHYAKGYTRAQEGTEWREKEIKQDVALAEQISGDRVKEESLANKKIALRANPELQELEARLKAGYIQKELFTQLEAKKAERIRIELQHQEEFYQLNAIQEAVNKFEEQRQIEHAKKKREYRESLQDQMIEKHKRKIEDYKMELKDKALIDDSVKVLEEADKREEEDRRKKIDQLRAEIEDMHNCRKVWLLREQEIQEEEERKINEYLEAKFKKEMELQDVTRKKEEHKLRFYDSVVKTLKESEGKRLEEEQINQILLDEESLRKEEAKLAADFEKKAKMKEELREVFAKQVEHKLQQKEEERKLDLQYCQETQREIEEGKKRDQELAKKKQLQNSQYREELKLVIEEKDKLRQRDLYRRINEYQTSVNDNNKRLKEIEEERLIMLQEHATRLLGFLPKGAIKKTDLPYLDPAIQKYYNYTPEPINKNQN
ncbi:meiosis-specific nuclear structural protein 1-like isoform X2 [Rhodnius prolixus]|uniref:meiosis-specific nuclear structural protein 1-like isoform X2 n=1 Tax=Rhodnius prolixus TaxID=13249 RepID=UPI003D18EF21